MLLTLCIMFGKLTCFFARLPGISANSNENYRHYNFQAFANISGNFPKYLISGKFTALVCSHIDWLHRRHIQRIFLNFSFCFPFSKFPSTQFRQCKMWPSSVSFVEKAPFLCVSIECIHSSLQPLDVSMKYPFFSYGRDTNMHLFVANTDMKS